MVDEHFLISIFILTILMHTKCPIHVRIYFLFDLFNSRCKGELGERLWEIH